MRFVDSNVFLHALLLPRRKLKEEEQQVKEEAKSIVRSIERGEEVMMTAAHLSEVVNIIETGLGLVKSLGFLAWVISTESIKVRPVTIEDYERALPIATDSGISANDALAYLSMKMHDVNEIYSFDKHLNRFSDIQRLPSL